MATTTATTNPQEIPVPSFWDTLSRVLGNASAGRATGRQLEAGFNLDRDRLKTQQYGQQSTNAFNQGKFQLDAPSTRAQQAVHGDVLANSKDAEFTGLPSYVTMPKVSGGLRPSMLSDTTRQAGRDMTANAGAKMGHDAIDYPNAPELTPVPQAGVLDSILNAGGTTAGILAALSQLGKGGGGGSGGSGGGGDPIQAIRDIIEKIKGKPKPGPFPNGYPASEGYGVPEPPQGNSSATWGVGPWPDSSSSQPEPLDPSQLPGYNDPMQEYYDWLAQQQGGGGTGGNDGFGESF